MSRFTSIATSLLIALGTTASAAHAADVRPGPLPAHVTTFVTPLPRATTGAGASGRQAVSAGSGASVAMDSSLGVAVVARISDIRVA